MREPISESNSGRTPISRVRSATSAPPSIRLFLALWLCSIWSLTCAAQVPTRDISVIAAAPEQTTRRVALVIGNSTYSYAGRIPGAVQDSRLIRDVLKELDFDVVYEENADKFKMDNAMVKFTRMLPDAAIALVYYSGHGVQWRGENYLIPVNARLSTPSSLPTEAVSLTEDILPFVASGEVRLNLILLDACRTNPFGKNWTVSAKSGLASGLGQMTAPAGFIIGYATAPGATALDGGDRPGPYASALAAELGVAGQRLDDTLKGVYERVLTTTSGEQMPWTTQAIGRGDVYLVPTPMPAAEPAIEIAPALTRTEPVEASAPTMPPVLGRADGPVESGLPVFPAGTSLKLVGRHWVATGHGWLTVAGETVARETVDERLVLTLAAASSKGVEHVLAYQRDKTALNVGTAVAISGALSSLIATTIAMTGDSAGGCEDICQGVWIGVGIPTTLVGGAIAIRSSVSLAKGRRQITHYANEAMETP